jgi:hypothetical protein
MRKDLQYAIEKEWFGAPKDCVPKSALQQILDASKPKQYAVVCRKAGVPDAIILCETVEDIKKLSDDGYRIHIILDQNDMKQIAAKLT